MLSIVIITKNEEKNIVDCLETALWADEIIVVDDNSEDRTVEIVKNLENKKIKIYKNALQDDFSKQRNFGLSKTTKKWVMFLDADERITDSLHEEINTVIIEKQDKVDGYFIKRRDVLWTKELKHGEVGNVNLLRLAKRDSGIWLGKVHEIWNVMGKTDTLENPLFHYPHPTVNDFLKEINYYSTLRAKELFEQKKKVSGLDIILYPKGKFLLNYFLKLGFLDGMQGLVLSIIMSFHSFLVRGKLWQLWQKNSTS